MRCTSLSTLAAGLLVTCVLACSTTPARAQNDWQYPDPYFGVLEIEKSHDGATARRYRGTVNPAPRPNTSAAPSARQTLAGKSGEEATGAATATPVARPRWRSRWRR